jgi:ribosomal protein S18 acetylase RimI-like enzyme
MAEEIVPLQRMYLDEAAALLARAFFDDPLTLFTMPDERERALALPRLMRAALLNGLDAGVVQANHGSPTGVAIWLPPESLAKSLTLPESSPTTVDRVSEVLDAETFRRMNIARDALYERQQADVRVEHWHLTIIGVDPVVQRSGLGGRLMAPTLAIADGMGTPCYLETYREENLAFYGQHGFEVLATAELPESGPRFWTMLRQPKTT